MWLFPSNSASGQPLPAVDSSKGSFIVNISLGMLTFPERKEGLPLGGYSIDMWRLRGLGYPQI
jgi:hypothetical protein